MNIKKILITFIVLLNLVSLSPTAMAKSNNANNERGKLSIGIGKANITPPASMFPFQCHHENYPHTGIHDSLYARVIVMDNGCKRAVLAEIDEVAVPDAKNFLAKVAMAAKVNTADVLLCVSHTHSTLHPNGEDERLQTVIDHIESQTVKATEIAASNLQPAYISFGRTQSYVNINNGEVVQSKGQYDEKAFSDKTLDIIKFCRPDSSTIAMVVNYPTHAEVMFRSRSRDGGFEITGDLPGRVAQLLENSGDKPMVLTTAGAEGDQQPIFTSRQHTSTMGFIDQKAGGWSIVDVLAHRLVDDINEKTSVMPLGENNVSLSTMATEAIVPGQHRHGFSEEKIIDEPAEDVHIPINRINIGDIEIAGVGADIASKIGVAVRNASTVKNTMLITVTAGQVGYILPDEMYKNYTHAVFGSVVRPGYSQEAIIKALNK